MRPLSVFCAALFLLLPAARCRAGGEGLGEIARIQTGLNRVAAGLPPGAESADPFEQLVKAFSAGWASPGAFPARAAPILTEIEAEAARRFDRVSHAGYPRPETGSDLAGYLADLDKAAASSAGDPLARFIITLHRADAVLIAENVNLYGFDYHVRDSRAYLHSSSGQADGAWLRVPCRALPGREEAFRRAIAELGGLAGPVLDCPAPGGEISDPDALARFARDPAGEAGAAVRVPRRKPVRAVLAQPGPGSAGPGSAGKEWDRETAVALMASDPGRAEPVLRQAATPAGKLDYALFLFAFRSASAERDERIRMLLTEVDPPEADANQVRTSTERPGAFDGSLGNLVGHLRWDSLKGKAQTESAFYAIPCAVLVRVPALLEATKPQFYSNMDNFLPRSGCQWGRGSVRGFPEAETQAFMDAAEKPTHDFLANYDGTFRYGLYANLAEAHESLRVDPKGILAATPAKIAAPPYLVWSYLSLDNRRIQAATQAAFERATTAVSAYYRSRGLTEAEAEQAADAGLRRLALGWNCGGAAVPPPSFRTLLLDGATLAHIKAFAASGRWRDPQVTLAFRLCAQTAGLDPLVHVAAARPEILRFLLDFAAREPDASVQGDLDLAPEARNAFGKTPLMTAAQFDQPDSARLLLARNADPNARTDATGTDWARRTPLMYAAASGSLATIKLLLAAGADPQMADSKGLRALHYLLGLGPVAANARLSAGELGQAARLLY